jgi:hypothetical protein
MDDRPIGAAKANGEWGVSEWVQHSGGLIYSPFATRYSPMRHSLLYSHFLTFWNH